MRLSVFFAFCACRWASAAGVALRLAMRRPTLGDPVQDLRILDRKRVCIAFAFAFTLRSSFRDPLLAKRYAMFENFLSSASEKAL